MTAFVFFGGAAGIVAIRRGDRLNVFVQAGLAVALVDALVVTTFALLGERDDLTGVLQLWGASAARRRRRGGRRGRARSPSSATCSGS